MRKSVTKQMMILAAAAVLTVSSGVMTSCAEESYDGSYDDESYLYETEMNKTSFDFRDGVTWDMLEEDILWSEGNPACETVWTGYGPARLLVIRDVSAAGAEGVTLTYTFAADKLMQASYAFPAESISYDQLLEALASVYAEPSGAGYDRQMEIMTALFGEADPEEPERYTCWELDDGTFILLSEKDGSAGLCYTDEPGALAAALPVPEMLAWGTDPEQAMAAAGIDFWYGTEDEDIGYYGYYDGNEHSSGPYPILVFKNDQLIEVTREFRDEYGLTFEDLKSRYERIYGSVQGADKDGLIAAISAMSGEEEEFIRLIEDCENCASWELDNGTTVMLMQIEEGDTGMLAYNLDFLLSFDSPDEAPEQINTDGL